MSLLELFRVLSSFSPSPVDLSRAPWDEYTDWAIGQGLGPLAAYNLEYRLGQCGAPQWARDRLLSIYQGSANDNVMKLVNFKRAVDELAGRRLALIGGASFAEALYPHVAFRPVVDLRVLVAPFDVEPLTAYLRRAGFVPEAGGEDPCGADRVLSDTRTTLFIHGGLGASPAVERALLDRAVPMRAMGPSTHRLELEDALVVHVLLAARVGFAVPAVELVDLRELVLGAPALGGVYSRPVDGGLVVERARERGVERALWAAAELVTRLFPATAGPASGLRPAIPLPTRLVLENVVVNPVADLGRRRELKGLDAMRAALL